ncbi:MAG: hypothetical protein WBX03_03190 [Terriglobales bacterium]|jgi:hypothetical protein
MPTATAHSESDRVRQHAAELYLRAARRHGDRTFSVNVGTVHRAMGLNNRVPLVCAALTSKKFLNQNSLRLISKTGPPSGQSTTVTYTYEFVGLEKDDPASLDPWLKARGIAKDIFAALGGGEAYLRAERANFYGPGNDPNKER